MDTLLALAAKLASGTATSRDLVEECLARAGDPQGEGARVFTAIAAENARAAADGMDRLRKAGAAPSAYAGIPLGIKDLFDIAGEVTTAGSRVLAANPPAQTDAVAVAAARCGLRVRRPHQHGRIRLFGPRHKRAFRHAAQSLRSQHRAHTRGFLLWRGCRHCRWHVCRRPRDRYRRFLQDSRRPVRDCGFQADGAAGAARGCRALVLDAGFGRAAGAQRRLLRHPRCDPERRHTASAGAVSSSACALDFPTAMSPTAWTMRWPRHSSAPFPA